MLKSIFHIMTLLVSAYKVKVNVSHSLIAVGAVWGGGGYSPTVS